MRRQLLTMSDSVYVSVGKKQSNVIPRLRQGLHRSIFPSGCALFRFGRVCVGIGHRGSRERGHKTC
jgi:hypothetical protein